MVYGHPTIMNGIPYIMDINPYYSIDNLCTSDQWIRKMCITLYYHKIMNGIPMDSWKNGVYKSLSIHTGRSRKASVGAKACGSTGKYK